MPSARITKTFWVASKRATPPQMAAIQNHRGESEWMLAWSITGSYFTISRMHPTMQRIDGCLQGNRGWASGSGLPEGGMQEPGRKAEAGAPKAFSTIPKKRESIKSRSSQDLFVLLKPSVLSKSDWLYSPSTRCVPMFVSDKSIHAANRLSFAADGLAMEAQFE